MRSQIAETLRLRFSPVAILHGDEKPEGALEFKPGRPGCVMFLFANAAKGRTAAFTRETCGCPGGVTGLGFGNGYLAFPGGPAGFEGFLSHGNGHTEEGRRVGQMLKDAGAARFADLYLNGECYKRSPAIVHEWCGIMPFRDTDAKYVLFKPLDQVGDGEKPEVIVFTVNAEQISSLVILANYERSDMQGVSMPWAAGCQLIGLLPMVEGESASPRAIAGLTDLSARNAVRNTLGRDVLTFAVPWKLYLEMEGNAGGCFFRRHDFAALQG